ncbi:MAG: response regulator [Isosphaeraceae bacterium]
MKILLVDDHEGTRRALQLVLRSLNCSAEVAENGQEALELLRQREFDLVLMDLMMPVMDGPAATRQIRQERAAGSGPRIVGISADSEPESRELCLSVGMNDFLAKPLEVQELIRVLDEAARQCVLVACRVEFATSILDVTPTAQMAVADHILLETVSLSLS